MKLLFEDKETKGDILSRAKLVSPINTSDDMSYLFYGDNFEIMSALLNGRKGFIDLIYIDPPFNTN